MSSSILTTLPVDDTHDLDDVIRLYNRHRFLGSVIRHARNFGNKRSLTLAIAAKAA